MVTEDTSPLIENPTNADILHLEAQEADRLAGAVMNDFSRELVMVITNFPPIQPFHLEVHLNIGEKCPERQRKTSEMSRNYKF